MVSARRIIGLQGGFPLVRGNVIIATIALAIAGVTYVLAAEFDPIVDGAPGPGYVPNILATSFVVLALALLAQTWFMWRKERRKQDVPDGGKVDNEVKSNPFAMHIVYSLIGVCTGYALLIGLFGFVIASLAFIPVGMWIMGERSIKHMILLSIGVVGLFYLTFAKFFNMILPTGMLFE